MSTFLTKLPTSPAPRPGREVPSAERRTEGAGADAAHEAPPDFAGELAVAQALTIGPETPQALTIGLETPQALTIGLAAPQALTIGLEAPQALTIGPETPQALTIGLEAPQALTIGPETPRALTIGLEAPQALRIGAEAPERLAARAVGSTEPWSHAHGQPRATRATTAGSSARVAPGPVDGEIETPIRRDRRASLFSSGTVATAETTTLADRMTARPAPLRADAVLAAEPRVATAAPSSPRAHAFLHALLHALPVRVAPAALPASPDAAPAPMAHQTLRGSATRPTAPASIARPTAAASTARATAPGSTARAAAPAAAKESTMPDMRHAVLAPLGAAGRVTPATAKASRATAAATPELASLAGGACASTGAAVRHGIGQRLQDATTTRDVAAIDAPWPRPPFAGVEESDATTTSEPAQALAVNSGMLAPAVPVLPAGEHGARPASRSARAASPDELSDDATAAADAGATLAVASDGAPAEMTRSMAAARGVPISLPSLPPSTMPTRPTSASPSSSPASSAVSERDAPSRAANDDARTDSDEQARPSEKAPPAPILEVVEKGFVSPSAADKRESSASRSIRAASVEKDGGAPSVAGASHRPTFLDVAAAGVARLGGGHAAGAAPAARAVLPWSPSVTEAGAHGHALASAAAPFGREPAALAAAIDLARAAPSTAPPSSSLPGTTPGFPPPPPRLDGAAPGLSAPPPFPALPSAFLAAVSEDLSLRATVMPERAVLSIDTGTGGEMALHLRIKDGVADVRLSGAGAESLDVRPQELRTALAGEGLTLGTFESGQSPSQSQSQSSPGHADVDPRDLRSAPGNLFRTAPAPAPTLDVGGADKPTPWIAGRGVHVTA
jgi:hypothetical protein